MLMDKMSFSSLNELKSVSLLMLVFNCNPFSFAQRSQQKSVNQLILFLKRLLVDFTAKPVINLFILQTYYHFILFTNRLSADIIYGYGYNLI